MPRNSSIARWAGVAAVFVATVGCGDGRVTVYRVRGKVTFEGKPMAGGGSISFVPLTNQAGKTAGGEIAADGSYELTTYSAGDGSMAGEFRVVISQVTEREPDMTKDGERPGKSITTVGKADQIPAIYSDPQKSPLTAKVEAKDPNEINFDLKRNAGGQEPIRGAGLGGPRKDRSVAAAGR
jgi:hypothetical protein